MPQRRVALAPDRMTEGQLWERSTSLVDACRWRQHRTPQEREKLLDELRAVLFELRLRGSQLELLRAK